MKSILASPFLYHAYQVLGGFFNARVIILNDLLKRNKNIKTVIDIGCGPGHISTIFEKIDYMGFDTNKAYINYANNRFNEYGKFYCEEFNDNLVENINKVDLIMLNGLLHHLDDKYAIELLKTASKALKEDGILVTLDGVYHKNQSKFAKYLLDNDRGKHVRTEEKYRLLMDTAFSTLNIDVREDLSRLPYTFIIMYGNNK
jgi:SAM-dependent methyltransferase